MSAFEAASWTACLSTSIFLILSLRKRRHYLIKPSFIIGILLHVQIQWAATIRSSMIAGYVPNPWIFWVLTHGFTAAVLVLSRCSPSRTAAQLFSVARHSRVHAPGIHRTIVLLLVAFLSIISVYLYFRPINTTGLYAILVEPVAAESAREYSLKLLDSALLRYAVVFAVHVVSPLLVVLLAAVAVRAWVRGRLGLVLGIALICLVVLIGVSLPGHRSFAILPLVAMFYIWALKRGFRINGLHVAGALALFFTIPTLITIARQDESVTWENYRLYFVHGILDRVFNGPMETALWHVHYAQTVGFFGVAAIPKLAAAIEVEPVIAPNVIGRQYANVRLETQYSNTSFIFSYYSYFGAWSIPLSFALLLASDLVLALYANWLPHSCFYPVSG